MGLYVVNCTVFPTHMRLALSFYLYVTYECSRNSVCICKYAITMKVMTETKNPIIIVIHSHSIIT